ncbi:MAG: DUF2062 domain-containing protein [Cyanobacteria bacterium]|nr:DUF2062 domain-containing protein [Cyanobacteriota bacterium]
MPRHPSQSRPPGRPVGPARPKVLGSRWRPLRIWSRRLHQNLRKAITWMRRQEGSPGHQARGLAIGVFIGCLPIFGLQMLVSLGLANAMRGNRFLAMAGTWISNPITNLPLFWLSYQLGSLLMGPGAAGLQLKDLNPDNLAGLGWAFSIRLILGSVLVGGLLAAASGVGYRQWLHFRRRRLVTPPR